MAVLDPVSIRQEVGHGNETVTPPPGQGEGGACDLNVPAPFAKSLAKIKQLRRARRGERAELTAVDV